MSSSPDQQVPVPAVSPQDLVDILKEATKPPKVTVWASVAMVVLTFLYVLMTGAAFYVAHLAYQGSNRQQEVFEKQVALIDQATETLKEQSETARRQATLHAEELRLFEAVQLAGDLADFRNAMDRAEGLYRGCPTCEPSYMVSIHLDIAARLETKLADHLSTAEYVRLAGIGSAVWSFETLDTYCHKALEKAKTPIDRHFALLMLGHTHFIFLGHDQRATAETARKCINDAIIVLASEPSTMNNQYFLGAASEAWAAHEMFQKKEDDANQKKKQASAYWVKLPNHESLERRLESVVGRARSGFPPNAPAYFSVPQIAPTEPETPTPAAPAPQLPTAA